MDVRTEGLPSAEAAQRFVAYGPNSLPETPPTPIWRRALRQFHSPLIYILLFALVFDAGAWIYEGAQGAPIEAIVIAAVLLLNAGLGTFQEHRSEQALARLRALAAPLAWVIRDHKLLHLPSSQIVPGDVVRVEAGDRVSADGRLVEEQGVMVDEAVLTGESAPVDKALGDEVFSGTLVVRGKGLFEVSGTGVKSSMGRLASMLSSIEAGKTPLERRLAKLGHQIALWVGGLAAALTVAGMIAEGMGRFQETILFAVALAVAAVPESMPAVVTLTLALGLQRMARRRAVVRRLSAVEALGSVTVIATDKTGTLTENLMRVHALECTDEREALATMVLANDADDGGEAGDPLDLGLLAHARAAGVDIPALRAGCRRVGSLPFDSAWKFMRVTIDDGKEVRSYLKGAPEALLTRTRLSPEERARWAARAEAAARGGHRVLALARGPGEDETELDLLGLVLLWDPPRSEVPDAIRTAQQAGVRVVMITGDHPGTAAAVAKAIGMERTEILTGEAIDQLPPEELRRVIRETSIFARVSPAHKLRIVEALQQGGDIVAMTGDGVNDAPALKRADVGVAMGQRGSDVTREVADLVLLDDNFATIVAAIEEGRGIYENIQKFIRFMFSTNLALVILVVMGAVSAYAMNLREASGLLMLPLTAIQLLWINFIGDGPPALALALDRSPGVMSRPPRPASSPLLDPPSLRFVLSTGAIKALIGGVLLIVLPVLGYAVGAVRTIVFLFESTVQLVFTYPSRRLLQTPLRNRPLHIIVALSMLLQLATVLLSPLRRLLGLEAVDGKALGIVLLCVALTWGVAEGVNWLLTRRYRGAHSEARP